MTHLCRSAPKKKSSTERPSPSAQTAELPFDGSARAGAKPEVASGQSSVTELRTTEEMTAPPPVVANPLSRRAPSPVTKRTNDVNPVRIATRLRIDAGEVATILK